MYKAVSLWCTFHLQCFHSYVLSLVVPKLEYIIIMSELADYIQFTISNLENISGNLQGICQDTCLF